MTMRIAAALPVVLLLAAVSSCKGTAIDKKAASPSAPVPAADLTGESGCSGLRTAASLLTPEVRNGAADSKLAYEIFVTDCDGNRRPFSSDRILFDVEAEIGQLLSSPYTASASGAVLNGALEGVEGEDLFGRKGPEYFHHRTDRALATAGADEAVLFSIDLSGQSFFAIGGANERHFSAKTHLRVGSAAPVTLTVSFTD